VSALWEGYLNTSVKKNARSDISAEIVSKLVTAITQATVIKQMGSVVALPAIWGRLARKKLLIRKELLDEETCQII